MKLSNSLAVGALWAGPALAQGSVSITNACGSSVSIGGSTIAPGGGYSQVWNAQDVSLKMAPEGSAEGILQFEYSLSGDTVFWDLSQIDGSPFDSDWSLGGSDGCDVRQVAYQNPNDSGAQQSCPSSGSVYLTLCASGNIGGSPSGSPSGAPSASPAATPSAKPSRAPSGGASRVPTTMVTSARPSVAPAGSVAPAASQAPVASQAPAASAAPASAAPAASASA